MIQATAQAMTQAVPLRDLPPSVRNLDCPPRQLYVQAGDSETFRKLLLRKKVAIVGTRRISAYGQAVTAQLAGELAANGIVIISGLALGVDAIAHRAALEAGGLTIAILPSPVEAVHPRSHQALARQIVEHGGVLASEYSEGTPVYKTNFVYRNRLVAALADALVITEAAENSGTMHTARFALEQGIELMVVPGNITSPTSAGTNNLLKTGAHPVTGARDIFNLLGLSTTSLSDTRQRLRGANSEEQQLIDLLERGITSGSELLSASGLSIEKFNHHLTMLEITAKIRPLGANQWSLV